MYLKPTIPCGLNQKTVDQLKPSFNLHMVLVSMVTLTVTKILGRSLGSLVALWASSFLKVISPVASDSGEYNLL